MVLDSESVVRGPFTLGEWTVDPVRFRLTRDDAQVQVRPRAMEVLLCLADQAGSVVSKRRLIDTVWRAEFVSENALTHVIAELRTALGDHAQDARFIETVPRRGYRLLLSPVDCSDDELRGSATGGRPQVGEQVSRYRILELLGEGGVGVVVRARDERMGREVAVKLLRPELVGDAAHRQRFEQEARAAGALAHPNIVAIHDIGTHDGKPFIVSELLQGVSLRDLIAEDGLTVADAVDYALQIADGLAAAHSRGIVHRDLKPENLYVTREGRVKILDFGLVKLLATDDGRGETHMPTAPIDTSAGMVVGTVGYMSPEQVRAQPADHRADIFALGAVLYEMLSGHKAFVGHSSAEVMAAILREDPPLLESFRSGVSSGLDRIVRRCLEKLPEDRFQSTAELASELKAVAISSEASRWAPGRAMGWGRRRWFLAVGAALTVAAVATLVWMPRGDQPSSVTTQAIDPNRVVVATFTNHTGDPTLDSLGLMVADWITGGLYRVDGLEVAVNPYGSMGRGAHPPQNLGDSDPLQQLASQTRSALVVAGAYYLTGDQVEIQTRIVEPMTGNVVQTFEPVRAARSDPTPAAEELRQLVAGTLAAHFDATVELGTGPPVPLEAYQEFDAAMEAWGRNPVVVSHLERAVELAPDFDLARIMLVWALNIRGEHAAADEQLAILEDLMPRLSPLDRIGVRLTRASMEGRIDDVVKEAREAVRLAPGVTWMAVDLGSHLMAANRPREALTVVEEIPFDWAPAGSNVADWPFSIRARAHHFLGEYGEELRVATEGAEHFPGERLFAERRIAALAAMGRFDELDGAIEETITRLPRGMTPGRALGVAAGELRAHGYREEGLVMAERSLQWHRDNPRPQDRRLLAVTMYRAEHWDEARKHIEALAEETPYDVSMQGLRGVLAARRGDREAAERVGRELAILDRPGLRGQNTFQRACIAAQLGELDRAVDLLRQASGEGFVMNPAIRRVIDLEPLWDDPRFQELVAPKG